MIKMKVLLKLSLLALFFSSQATALEFIPVNNNNYFFGGNLGGDVNFTSEFTSGTSGPGSPGTVGDGYSYFFSSAFHYRANQSPNSIGFVAGDIFEFGARPSQSNENLIIGTADGFLDVVASQGEFTTPLTEVAFSPYSGGKFWVGNVPTSSNLTDSWVISGIAPDYDLVQIHTPPIENAELVPFVRNFSISNDGLTPTFNWTVPDTFTPDALSVRLFDRTITLGGHVFSGSTPNFTIPLYDPFSDLEFSNLNINTIYTIEISLIDTRIDTLNGSNLSDIPPYFTFNTSESNILALSDYLSISRSFFNFTLLPDNSPPNLFLPMVEPPTNSNDAPTFRFDIDVLSTDTYYIDPLVATGYTYETGVGNPNFASVILPTGIGDNFYNLFLFDSLIGDFVDSGIELVGGLEYFFDSGGVDRFRILGIETSAMLDPFNTTAFITGLTFTDSGTFSGTMTPIIEDVPLQAPEPTTLVLFGMGLTALAALKRHARSRSEDVISI